MAAVNSADLRFAGLVFRVSTILGVVIILPMFFAEERFAAKFPPAFTHAEFYYGFAAVTLAWQLAYYLISTDPLRYRPFMLVAAAAKGLFFASVVALWLAGRISDFFLAIALPDLVFCLAFVAAWMRLKPRSAE